jgi:hypothetical protein
MDIGLVPARWRSSVGEEFDASGPLRSWEAETDGRNRRCIPSVFFDMLFREVMSSPLAEGPADEKLLEPFCDLLSVDVLPLRVRRMYFSIASASRSRILVITGETLDDTEAALRVDCDWLE